MVIMPRVTLPIGTSNFAEIRREGWYYVDKTGLIRDLLNTRKAKVTLITRPRRFGKTLGMNMLASFHYSVESNREHGEGRSDMVVYDEENSRVVIFEAKVAKSPEELPAACDAALRQIEARQYAEDFRDEYDEILCYGIAFYKKRCLVKREPN